MPTHTPAKRAINRKRVKQARKVLKSVKANRKAGAKVKTISGLARNAAAKPKRKAKSTFE